MCVLSMVMDARYDDWSRRYWPNVPPVVMPGLFTVPYVMPVPTPAVPLPTTQEVDEFRRLLERAREYDRANGQPDCELESKRKRLRDMADALGVQIEFV